MDVKKKNTTTLLKPEQETFCKHDFHQICLGESKIKGSSQVDGAK